MSDSDNEEYCSAESEIGEDFEQLSFNTSLSNASVGAKMPSRNFTETSSYINENCDSSDDSGDTSAASESESETPPHPNKKSLSLKPQIKASYASDGSSQSIEYSENENSQRVNNIASCNKVYGASDDSEDEIKHENAHPARHQNQDYYRDTSSSSLNKNVKQESDDDTNIEFGYCDYPIELHGQGKTLYYKSFAKENKSAEIPVFDSQLIGNLSNLQIERMRPVQVAAFQALFFSNPNTSNPSDKQPDFLGISQTGSGKTFAFLVPVIQKCIDRIQTLGDQRNRNPMVLIFAHSKPLVKNIYERAVELTRDTGVDVQLIMGKTSYIQDTHFDIGLCTRGRFEDHFGEKRKEKHVILNITDVKYLIIDEADKMAEEDKFVFHYREMKQKADFTTLAFSATNSYEVSEFLDTENYYQFLYGALNTVSADVEQIMWQVNSQSFSQCVGAVHGKTKFLKREKIVHPMDFLLIFLREKRQMRSMIFVKRTLVAEVIARKLTLHGLDAVAVHGDQSPESQNKFLKYFNEGKVQIIVATNLLTRGTDIPVDYVINYDLPLSYTAFVHRCGRTGRNGKKGRAITLIDLKNPEDYPPQVLQEIIVHLPADYKIPEFLVETAKNLRNTKKNREEYIAQENCSP